MDYKDLEYIYIYLKNNKIIKSKTDLAEKLGYGRSYTTELLNGTRTITDDFRRKLLTLYYFEIMTLGKLDLFEDLESFNQVVKSQFQPKHRIDVNKLGSILNKSDKEFIEIRDGISICITKLVQAKHKMEYLRGWGDPEYVETLPDYPVVVNEIKERYLSFESDGDNMDNGDKEAINAGDIVTGKRIGRHLWKIDKLDTYKFPDYIIHHKDGLFIERIIEHNIEAGTILCHSINPDKNLYPDFTLNVDDISQLFNIVTVTQIRK